jgi:hypothetical protein
MRREDARYTRYRAHFKGLQVEWVVLRAFEIRPQSTLHQGTYKLIATAKRPTRPGSEDLFFWEVFFSVTIISLV